MGKTIAAFAPSEIEYEAPRLARTRFPGAERQTGTTASWNIVCSDCSSGGAA